jgi:uncharacterized protein YdhG (YjbR/CyaY superfamily)
MGEQHESIEAYVASFPAETQAILGEVLHRFRVAAPGATEAVRYGMPAFRLTNGRPVYFAAWKQHLSLHDIPVFSGTLEAQVAPYRSGKDTLKFPYRSTIPFDLIEQVVHTTARPSG